MNAMSAIKEYSAIDKKALIEEASPHRLIALLLSTLKQRVQQARHGLERQDAAATGTHLSKALDILSYLTVCVEPQPGATEISDNLRSLYSYMERRILEANRSRNGSILLEVTELIGELEEGWVNSSMDNGHG